MDALASQQGDATMSVRTPATKEREVRATKPRRSRKPHDTRHIRNTALSPPRLAADPSTLSPKLPTLLRCCGCCCFCRLVFAMKKAAARRHS